MVTKTFTYEGKRYYIRAKTEQEALIKMANMIRDLEEGKVAISGNMTVRQWTERAISTYKTGLKPNTLKKYTYAVNHYILDLIGERPIKSIKPIECQEVLNHWAGYSKFILKQTSQNLKFIFSTAVLNKIILDNPAENLTMPTGTKNNRRTITDKEREHLQNVTDQDMKEFVLNF